MNQRLMAVFAHPDDESCGPGGTLALYAHRGVEVTIICATRGELGGEPGPDKRPDAELGAVRAQELQAACQALGLARCVVLDFPDGELAGHIPALRTQFVRLIRPFQPHVLLTFDPDSMAGGPDHQAVGKAVSRAFWVAGEPTCCDENGTCNFQPYRPLRLFYWLVRPCCDEGVLSPDEMVVTVDVTAFLEKRRAALSCHRSQAACSGQASARLSEPDEALERFRLDAARLPMPPGGTGDLFAGIAEAG